MMTETDDQLVSGNASIITVLKSMAKILIQRELTAQRINLLMWQSDSPEPIKITGTEKRNHAFPYTNSLTDFVCCSHEGKC
jgi:hypothetical protein